MAHSIKAVPMEKVHNYIQITRQKTFINNVGESPT
uniref:Uncharacterized protein n=1 Tax=Dulem virus 42 TaxID=3145760 RepID=A0AAU8B864_9CAUD